MIKAFVLFHLAILHGHVAVENGGFNMAEKGKGKGKTSIFSDFSTMIIS